MTTLDTPLFPPKTKNRRPIPSRPGDTRDGSEYILSDEGKLRVNVALATGRPLLIRGDPGTGKSSLAAHVARKLRWRYQEIVVTSRTEARDMQWRYETLAQLSDSHASNAKANELYVEPQGLWWALAPEDARDYGEGGRKHPFDTARDGKPRWKVDAAARDVVLIDEIDKADPEVPNDLLVAIGSLQFRVTESNHEVSGEQTPFLIFTTNAERDLPPAFVRRCVTLTLETPEGAGLQKIGKKHFPDLPPAIIAAASDRMDSLRAQADEFGLRAPSIAEYLDTLAACRELGVEEDSAGWVALTQATMWKHTQPSGDEAGDSE